MRLAAVAALAFALAACGGGDGGELAVRNSQLSQAQIDSALGPAGQSTVEDAIPSDVTQNGDGLAGNETAPATNSAAANDEDEQ